MGLDCGHIVDVSVDGSGDLDLWVGSSVYVDLGGDLCLRGGWEVDVG